MTKKKGANAKAKAKAKRRGRSPSPAELDEIVDSCDTLVLPDGRRVHRGLANLGNTCFMNSILQCLNVSLPFSDEMLMTAGAEGLAGLSGSLCSVFKGIRAIEDDHGRAANGTYTPKTLREQLIMRFPWYKGKSQHDAHELLRTLLGSITDEKTLAESRAKEAAEAAAAEGQPAEQAATTAGGPNGASNLCELCVTRNFKGHLCAATLCWGCHKVSLQLDAFLDVSLDLPMLSAQTIEALGVTAARLNGTDHLEALQEEAASSSKGKASKAKAKAKGKAASKPQGVWASRQDAAALQETRQWTRLYLGRVYSRILTPDVYEEAMQALVAAEAAAESAAAAAPARPRVEIELKRRQTSDLFGMRWNKALREEGKLVLADIAEDSPLDRWNLKRRSMGMMEEVACVGDELIEVNDMTSYQDITNMLGSAHQVSLVFVRPSSGVAKKPVKEDVENEEDERKERQAAERDSRRLAFGDVARQCAANLPADLLHVFGPQKVASGRHTSLQLEDCLKRFSLVEAVEEDYKAVYRCGQCSKASPPVDKTFASRRLWLWPVDLPPLLTLQLKRFRRYDDRYEKSAAIVHMPAELDLRPFAMTAKELNCLRPQLAKGTELAEKLFEADIREEDQLYELYAICEHRGDTMQMGHYVAFVNSGPSLEEEDWYGISDAKLWKSSRKEALEAEAYLAFYRRRPRRRQEEEAAGSK